MKTSRKILIILIAAILLFLIGFGIFKAIPLIRYGKSIFDVAQAAEELGNKYDENADEIDMEDLYAFQDAYLDYVRSTDELDGDEDIDIEELRGQLNIYNELQERAAADAEEEIVEEKKADNNVSLTFGWSAKYFDKDKIVEIYVANPKRSEKDASVQVWVGEYLLAESGLIAPGQEIQMIHANEELPEELKEILGGDYYHKGSVIVNYFDPETGEKEKVNAEIPMDVYFER